MAFPLISIDSISSGRPISVFMAAGNIRKTYKLPLKQLLLLKYFQGRRIITERLLDIGYLKMVNHNSVHIRACILYPKWVLNIYLISLVCLAQQRAFLGLDLMS